ncbi:MAG: ATP-binding cassette domain-containing protein [Spirochaetaceae bacterium]|jgi:molybdate transport system ATP-binding protein|nr:ATP-binding cassette domain-containing protein [Spirochaetaceae bacterium]
MSLKVSLRKRLSRDFSLEIEFETAGAPGLIHSGAVPGAVPDSRNPGSCLGILGVSGSGKSMTLKCIAGIETPDEGRISVNGRTLFDSAKKINLKPQERRIGYLFQNYALFPRMTVVENITAGIPFSRKERRDRAGVWIDRFGLTGLEHRYPAQLSGGQQQRTALARMLIRDPAVILLDEPFSALDTSLREQMQVWLKELLTSRDDVVMVTHSRDEAYKLCAEILVVDGGRVLRKDRTRELFANPVLVSVARLTGCKNISPVKQTGEKEIYALDWGLPLSLPAPVPPGVTHIGIRAHDLLPVWEDGVPGLLPNRQNQIRLMLTRRSEEPFEEAVLFTNADAGTPEGRGEIWWKFSKYLGYTLPQRLYMPPESLLLLR